MTTELKEIQTPQAKLKTYDACTKPFMSYKGNVMTTEWMTNLDSRTLFNLDPEAFEIEFRKKETVDNWSHWNCDWWELAYDFRARPRQPRMKRVKMLCWYSNDDAGLHWVADGAQWPIGYTRVPSEDKEIEILE